MKQLDNSETAQRTHGAPGKHPGVIKEFSALSFEEGRVAGHDAPAPGSPPPRPTPDGAQDLDIHHGDSAGDNPPPPERPGATRRGLQRMNVPVQFVAARHRAVRISAPGVHPGPESNRNVQPANPELAMKQTVLVLMFDAEPLSRLRLTRVLKADGYSVIWADTLREAFTLCEPRHVDLLLVDFNRPLRSAPEDFELLTSANPGLPVILLTDRKTEFEQTVGERIGAALEKPVGNVVLAHTITRLLSERRVKRAHGNRTTEAGARQVASSGGNSLENLQRRYDAPYAPVTPYRHWGINE